MIQKEKPYLPMDRLLALKSKLDSHEASSLISVLSGYVFSFFIPSTSCIFSASGKNFSNILKEKTLQACMKSGWYYYITGVNYLYSKEIENLIKKSAKGRSIWKTEFKKCYAEDEKKARRKIRNAQMEYSKALLHSIITKQSNDIIKECAQRLHSFYKKGLNDFAVYSNISENESPDKFKIVHTAYTKMNLFFVK